MQSLLENKLPDPSCTTLVLDLEWHSNYSFMIPWSGFVVVLLFTEMLHSTITMKPSTVTPILGTMSMGGQTTEAVATEQMKYFLSKGYIEIDTARMYCNGNTELLLGRVLKTLASQSESQPILNLDKIRIASKVNPFRGYNNNLKYQNVLQQSEDILHSLQKNSTEILYLHAPDIDTPIEETLLAINELYKSNKFVEFGLSNYAAWEVAYIHGFCKASNYPVPTVYQGMYNAITRDVERELFPCLQKLNIRFYAYNPLCGGLLTGFPISACATIFTTGLMQDWTGKHKPHDSTASKGTRFDPSNSLYRNRYWKDQYFQAISIIQQICDKESLKMPDCSLRWMFYHSKLSGSRCDGVIIGASDMNHLVSNLESCESGPLPESVVNAFDAAWELTKCVCEKYFRPWIVMLIFKCFRRLKSKSLHAIRNISYQKSL